MAVTYNYGAAPTYVKIASQTASASSSITFSSLPQGYTDLVIVIGSMTTDANGRTVYLRFNGDSGTNYSIVRMNGDGTTASSDRTTSQDHIRPFYGVVGSSTTTTTTGILHLQSYSNSAVYKTTLSKTAAGGETNATVGLWRNISPITSMVFSLNAGTFSSGTTFTIYGIKAALVPKASGGDIVVQDGSYWYHAFRTTGAFVPKQAITADVLVVAGGGAGGGNPVGNNYGSSGGGGAGGVFYATSQSLTSGTSYTSTVGAGGVGDAGVNSNGLPGSNSVFGSLTPGVGGGGGRSGYGTGSNGGSGGGGGGLSSSGSSSTQTGTGGTGYGYGSLSNASYYAGSGGGGAGATGAAPIANQSGGPGGAGLNTWSTWLSATGLGVSGYIAGGGGGGGSPAYGAVTIAAGGSGGGGQGGAGGTSNTPVSGAANTGGGGGGAGAANTVAMSIITAGSGGSGLIIVRYAI
jgi:hypothetical protein